MCCSIVGENSRSLLILAHGQAGFFDVNLSRLVLGAHQRLATEFRRKKMSQEMMLQVAAITHTLNSAIVAVEANQ